MPRYNLLHSVRLLRSSKKFYTRSQSLQSKLRGHQTRHISQAPWDIPSHALSAPEEPAPMDNATTDQTLPKVRRRQDGSILLTLPDAGIGGKILYSLQLRDHCSCSKCRHDQTKQRLLDTFSIPPDIKPKSYEVTPSGLQITWDNDGHESMYSWKWLRAQINCYGGKPMEAFKCDNVELWGSAIQADPPTVKFEEVMNSDDGVKSWTDLIRFYGFCFVDGCPPTPEATQKLLERIAFIRHTHYGGFWDFTSDLASKDTAYTSLALEAHTDNTYFSDPAGLQMFHLLSHTDGDGGESLFVDGFKAALSLYQKSHEAYKVLRRRPILAHASGNAGSHITPTKNFTVLEGYGKTKSVPHAYEDLFRVRWNNADRVALPLGMQPGYREWYDAARQFNNILRNPISEYWVKLEPGRPIIFNNWRVLHGRAAFTGKRRMCGGYINMDDYLSRWKTLHVGHEELLGTI